MRRQQAQANSRNFRALALPKRNFSSGAWLAQDSHFAPSIARPSLRVANGPSARANGQALSHASACIWLGASMLPGRCCPGEEKVGGGEGQATKTPPGWGGPGAFWALGDQGDP